MNIEQKPEAICVPTSTDAPNVPVPPKIPVYTPMPPAQKKPPIPFTGIDTFFAIMTLVCGYLFMWLVFPFSLGFGATLFTVFFYTLAFSYLKKSGVVPPKNSYGILASALLSALSLSLFTNPLIQLLNLLFLILCTAYWVACATSSRLVPTIGTYCLFDLQNQLFQVPFHNFSCAPTIIRGAAARNKKGKTILAIVLGLAAAVPLLALVISLLAQADPVFEALMKQVAARLGEYVMRFLLRLFPAFLIGCYLFGLLYGNLKKRCLSTLTTEQIDKTRKKYHVLPSITSLTILYLLCGVYLLFFAVQASNLFSAFLNIRPDGFTYAEYARRGFFELCKVAFINFSVLTVVSILATRKEKGVPKAVRSAIVLLSIETLLLIGTAFRKMLMYIKTYGLTQKRVYTSWFMLLLFVLFCIILISQFRRIPVEKCMVTAFAVCFLLLGYANVDRMIVTYNIQCYEAGTLQTLDVASFYAMPYAAAPHASKLYASTQDKVLKLELKCFLLSQNGWYGSEPSLQSMTVQQLLAEPYWIRSGN